MTLGTRIGCLLAVAGACSGMQVGGQALADGVWASQPGQDAAEVSPDQQDHGLGVAKSGWLVQLFGEKQEEVSPTASLPVPVRAAA